MNRKEFFRQYRRNLKNTAIAYGMLFGICYIVGCVKKYRTQQQYRIEHHT